MNHVDAGLINAGAWMHYSYGIRDALGILTVPIVEIHMSNIQASGPRFRPCRTQRSANRRSIRRHQNRRFP